MKKLLAILCTFILLTVGVSAQEQENVGSMPDSFWYGFKILGENMNLAFTFDKQKKAELQLKYAERRVAEANEMAKKGKAEEVKKTLEKRDKQMKEVEQNIETLKKEGKDTKAIEDKALASVAKHQEVLKSVLEKAPE